MSARERHSPEVREGAIRMVREHREEYSSEWAAIVSVSGKLGCSAETLRQWLRRWEIDSGVRDGVTSDQRARQVELER